jgi:hypothetical protein
MLILLHRLAASTSSGVVDFVTQPSTLTGSATSSQSPLRDLSPPLQVPIHGSLILVLLSIWLLTPPIFLLCVLLAISLFILPIYPFLLLDRALFVLTLFMFLLFLLFPT